MIKPPNFAKNAVPTPRGWTDSRSGELLLARKIKQTEIDEYLGLLAPVEVPESMSTWIKEEEVEVQQLNEAPVNNKSLQDMTKTELQELAAIHGIQYKAFSSKAKLIELIEDQEVS